MQFQKFILFLLLFHPSILFHLSIADSSQSTISWNSNITLFGSASLLNGSISLTNPTQTQTNTSSGRALYSNPIRFLDPLTREDASFSTRFTFSILPSPTFGDGLSFLLTSDPLFLNGFFGVFGPNQNCSNQTVTLAVEFDTNLDAELRDLDGNHVAFDVCTIYSSVSASVSNSGIDLKQRKSMTAWIEYKSSENMLTVWLSYSPSYRPVRPILVAGVNLSDLVREFMRNILGRGSSATVYEGRLPSGSKIAVKRFAQTGHFTRTFASELGATIASCRHRNLVPLTGWCRYGDELMLVYEYMPNGTLHNALHRRDKPPLSWPLRYNILKGVATGLEFLHNRCNRRILHRDVKACNVLLDEGFNARLGDLGFAHLSSHGRDPQPTQVVGTPGYMRPEYVLTGVATEQADVYSFGVLTLQVATGRPPVQNAVSLVDWVWGMRERRRMVDAADPRLNGRFDQGEFVKVLLIGLACSYPNCDVRPSMRRVLRMLEGS
ncbi:hypothetical protein LUZ60_001113 [Juncus effusus]|nr:hypothetical protein LUZ60_001113 [Juncus effusus]